MAANAKFQRLLALAFLLTASPGCTVPHSSTSTQPRNCISRKALISVKLILAAEQGKVDLMDTMIKSGADVNTRDGLFGTPMIAATTSGNDDAVKLLLAHGANVNTMDDSGYTALMIATKSRNAEMVRRLLSNGADPNASNSRQWGKLTALSIAKLNHDEEIIKLLTDAGAQE